MADPFDAVFASLKSILAKHEKRLAVKVASPVEYTLLTRSPSPFPQHKGQPMFFGSVKLGKACVSFHLMPLYMCPQLNADLAPALKKRMQGKTCFNFKQLPEPVLSAELQRLTEASLKLWGDKKWL